MLTQLFGAWQVESHKETTERLVKRTSRGYAEACRCGSCEFWIRKRESALCKDCISPLADLGIDPKIEAATAAVLSDKDAIVMVQFRIPGRIVQGNEGFEYSCPSCSARVRVYDFKWEPGFIAIEYRLGIPADQEFLAGASPRGEA